MHLGRVMGTVVNAVACKGLTGVPFLIVQPLDKQQQPVGAPIVCCDATRMAGLGSAEAGPGELIYFEGGREAAMALEETFVPVDHTIIGIVDGVDLPVMEPPRRGGTS